MENKELEAIGLIGAALTALGNENRLNMARYIQDEGKATFAEIKDRFATLNVNTVRFHLKKIVEAQLVEQTRPRGPYKLTEFGEVSLGLIEDLKKDASSIIGRREKEKAEA